MLNIKVKTMDSASRSFQIPDSMTVKDFKQRIASSVNIPVESQRLIFQGRVLADTTKLTEDHHEKTFHLVERRSASNTSSATANTTSSSAGTTTASTGSSSTATPSGTGAAGSGFMGPTFNLLNQMFGQNGVFGGGNLMGGGGADPGANAMNIEINLDDRMLPNAQAAAGGLSNNANITASVLANAASAAAAAAAQQHHHHHVHARRGADARVHFERMWRILSEMNTLATNYASRSGTATEEAAPAPEASSESTTAEAAVENDDTSPTPMATSTSESNAAAGGNDHTYARSGTEETSPESQANLVIGPSSSTQRLRQPLVGELREFYTQFVQVQQRLQPLFNRYQQFLQDDPAYTSTNSQEYRDAQQFFTQAPQAFRHMADIFDFLGNITIPLERVPPRPVQTNRMGGNTRRSSSVNRHAGGAGGGARNTAEINPFHIGGGTATPAPSGTTAGSQQRASPFRHRIYMPRSQAGQTSARTATSGASSTATNAGGAGATAQRNRNNVPPAAAPTANITAPSLPPYSFQINATVHPRVTVHIGTPNNNSASTTQQQAANIAQQQPRTTAAGPQQQQNSAANNQGQAAPNVSRMSYAWNGSNFVPLGGAAAGQIGGIAANAVRNLVANATRGQPNQAAGVVMVDTANVNNVGEEVSRVLTNTLYSTLSSYLGQMNPQQAAANNQQQPQTHARPQQATTATNNTETATTTNEQVDPDVEEIEVESPPEETPAAPENLDASSSFEEDSVAADTGGARGITTMAQLGPSLALLANNLVESVRNGEPTQNLMLREHVARLNGGQYFETGSGEGFVEELLIGLFNTITLDDLTKWYRFGGVFSVDRTAAAIRQVFSDHMYDGDQLQGGQHVMERISRKADDIRSWLTKFYWLADIPCFDASQAVEKSFGFICNFLNSFINDLISLKDASKMNMIIRSGIRKFCSMNYMMLGGQNGRESFIKLLEKFCLKDSPTRQRDTAIFVRSLDHILPPDNRSGVAKKDTATSSNNQQSTTSSSATPSSNNTQAAVASAPRVVQPTARGWKVSVPSEWVKTLENDMKTQEKMQASGDQGFSEAYLAGMPANKRRK